MATWPAVPAHYRDAATGALRPPTPPEPNAKYAVYGEQFPQPPPSAPPVAADASAAEDVCKGMRDLNAAFTESYVDLLTCMATAPSSTYELQLKAQHMEEVMRSIQHALANEGRAQQAHDEIVSALRGQAARKRELVRALDDVVDLAESRLRNLADRASTSSAAPTEHEARAVTDGDARGNASDMPVNCDGCIPPDPAVRAQLALQAVADGLRAVTGQP